MTQWQNKEKPGEVGGKDCWTRKLNKEDAMDHSKWRKLIKDTV